MKQNPDKTDYSDARLLADLMRVGYLPKVWLAPDRIVELRRLVRFRQQLVNERRSVKLRMRVLLRDERLLFAKENSAIPGPRPGSPGCGTATGSIRSVAGS